MSKPLAAKGIGACLKHVLYTRLSSEASSVDRGGHDTGNWREDIETWHLWAMVWGLSMRLKAEGPQPVVVPIAEGDPLPPHDRLTMASILALDQLYAAQAPRLARFFARRLPRQEVSDLVQESFARMADAAHDPDKRIERPEAYLQQVANNVLRNRANSALQRAMAKQVPIEDALLTAPDAIAALEARDLLERLQKALARLPQKTGAIFLAHRVDGLSYKAIAENEGLSVKGVEWHMRKAITHLVRTPGIKGATDRPVAPD